MMTRYEPQRRVAVVGGSGFVGRHVVHALHRRQAVASVVRAPRLEDMEPEDALAFVESEPMELDLLTQALTGYDVVVNAAGVSDAASTRRQALVAANSALPGLIAAASRRAGARRFVHVSTAGVQGRKAILDETMTVAPFSDYTKSKALGERLALHFSERDTVIYRPPGVQGDARGVTKSLVKFAASPASSIARPRTSPTPQAMIDNVADALSFLAVAEVAIPQVVMHPWEGLTTSTLLELLGGRQPVVLPRPLASAIVGALFAVSRPIPRLSPHARRVEMLWFGQRQGSSWLTSAGWTPISGQESWSELGVAVRRHASDLVSEFVQ